jgi:hypothetical protein
VPPTTTTTLCSRPSGLSTFVLFTDYTIDAVTTDTTVSAVTACDGVSVYNDSGETVTMSYLLAEAVNLNIGQVVYDGTTGFDCTLIPDGWYFTGESAFGNFVYHIVGGIVTEISFCTTTTTTTIAPEPVVTTTTTTTIAPEPVVTTTTTTTATPPAPVIEEVFISASFATSETVCDTFSYPTGVYAADNEFFVGDTVYTDSGLTTTFNGGSLWYKVDGGDGIRIDGSGLIIDSISCGGGGAP